MKKTAIAAAAASLLASTAAQAYPAFGPSRDSSNVHRQIGVCDGINWPVPINHAMRSYWRPCFEL